VGDQEVQSETVNVRNNRDAAEGKGKGDTISVAEVLAKMDKLRNERRNDNEL
jgi:threonyl-tRNA synthetase